MRKYGKVVENSVVAYLDILGYKDKIKECNNDKIKLDELLNKLILELEIAKTPLFRSVSIPDSCEIKTFSDCFVISYKLHSEDSDIEIGRVLRELSDFQYNLAANDFFIRGGISISFNYIDDNIVFGPGLLSAYELESKIANYPRILLDENAVNQIKLSIDKTKSISNDDGFKIARYILKDQDDHYFLNYLQATKDVPDNQAGVNCQLQRIERHKSSIIKALEDNINNDKVFVKYRWVAEYHNWFCKNNFEQYPDLIVEGYDRKFNKCDDLQILTING